MPKIVADELAGISLFTGVARVELDNLGRRAVVRRLSAGQMLFAEGDPSDHLVLLRSGRLRVLVSSDRGDELVLTVVGAGEVLGELSVLDGLPRSATVEALEASEVVLLPAVEARDVLVGNPEALVAVTQRLAEQVRRLTGNAADLVFLDLPRRLAKLILSHARTGKDGLRTADLGVSQSGLAAQLGTTRQTVNRALAGLAGRGWLVVDGSRITIHDEGALRRFSEAS